MDVPTDWYKNIPPIRISKGAENDLDTILANSEKMNYTHLRIKYRAWLPYERSKNVKLEGRRRKKTNDFPHPVSITGHQVDNLPNVGSSFRIVSFRKLVTFLLLLSLGFIYQGVFEKKRKQILERQKTYFQNFYLRPLPCPC